MGNATKTTLNLDTALMRRAKARAAEEGRTLTSLVESALRAALEEDSAREPYDFDPPTLSLGDLPFDVADRNAMYDWFDANP